VELMMDITLHHIKTSQGRIQEGGSGEIHIIKILRVSSRDSCGLKVFKNPAHNLTDNQPGILLGQPALLPGRVLLTHEGNEINHKPFG